MKNGLSIFSVLVVLALMGMASAAAVGYSCSVTPSSSSVEAGQSVSLSTKCFEGGTEVSCQSLSYSATLGTISGSTFTAGSAAGNAAITASAEIVSTTPESTSAGGAAAPVATTNKVTCSARVTISVTPPPAPTATGCTISPSTIVAPAQTETPFTVSCIASGGATGVACPAMYLTSTIGSVRTIANGMYAFNSGSVAGTGTLTARSSTSAVQTAGAKAPLGADLTGTGVLVAALVTTGTASTGFSCTALLNVQSIARVPTTISVVPASAATTVGGTVQFSTHVYDQNGLEIAGLPITWTTSAMITPSPTPTAGTTATANALVTGTSGVADSAANSCGTVTSTGLFTGRLAGSCKVVAKVPVSSPTPSPTPTANALVTGTGTPGYITGEAMVSVSANSNPVPTTVVVSPASASVYVNGQQKFDATVYDQFGSSMGTAVTWSVTPAASSAVKTGEVATANALIGASTSVAPTTTCGTIAPDQTSRSANAAVFTAQLAGKCRIEAKIVSSAREAPLSGYADVTVLASLTPVPTTVVVLPNPVTISVNGRQQFTASVYDQNGVEMTTGQKVTWSVSTASATKTGIVATASALIGSIGGLAPATACGGVDSTGLFTGRLAGSCRVVAKVSVPSTKAATPVATASALIGSVLGTTGYIQGYADVRVVDVSTGGTPTSVVVVAASSSSVGPADSAADRANNRHRVMRNTKQQFNAYVYDESGNLMPGVPVRWSVITESLGDAPTTQIGTIDQNGVFTGRISGLGKVMATVFVSAPTIPTTANALIGSSVGAAAIQGTLDIEVVSDVQASSMTCTIIHPNREADLLKVRVNSNTQLSASCVRGGSEVVCPTLDWASTIGNVYSVSVVGDVTFNSGSLAGTGSITATGSDQETGEVFTCSLPVTVTSGVPTSITVSPSSATVAVGNQQQFSAIVRDEFGNEMGDSVAVEWTLETDSLGTAANNQIGSIDKVSGLFTARITGTGRAIATVTNSPDGNLITGQAKISVVAAQAQLVCMVEPYTLQIGLNQQQVYSVSCSDDAGNVLDCPQMGWSSTIGKIEPNPDGTVNSALFSSGSTPGTGTVTASDTTSDSLACSGKVAVGSGTPGMPFGINIDPASVSLSVGQSQKFVATVYDDAGNVLDPNAQDTWYLQWTSDGGIGKVDDTGYFAATAPGQGTVSVEVIGPWMRPTAIMASAKVSVTATQTGIYCRLNPSELTIAANAEPQAFEVRCYDPNTPSAGPIDPEVACPEGMEWSATIGSISVNVPGISVVQTAAFTPGSVAGTGTVTAVGVLTTATVATSLISCSAPVTVTGGTLNSMQLVPTSASLYVGDTQDFDAYGYDAAGNSIGKVADSQLQWTFSGSSGTVDSAGIFTASSVGSGTVKATYLTAAIAQVIEATASVTVSSTIPGPGGNGGAGSGSNSGGGSFATASTLSYTCAAEPGSLAVRILKPGATMLAEIWSVGGVPAQKVFSQTSSSDGTYSFTVPKAGDYEIRITADSNQRSVSFNMPECTPATKEEPKEINIEVKEPEVPKVPEQPKPPATTVTAVAPAAQGIPAWALLLGAVLLLAAAYFLVFGKKKAAA